MHISNTNLTLKKENEMMGGYFVSKQTVGFQKTVIRITVNIYRKQT